jgi:hypothetical protein
MQAALASLAVLTVITLTSAPSLLGTSAGDAHHRAAQSGPDQRRAHEIGPDQGDPPDKVTHRREGGRLGPPPWAAVPRPVTDLQQWSTCVAATRRTSGAGGTSDAVAACGPRPAPGQHEDPGSDPGRRSARG